MRTSLIVCLIISFLLNIVLIVAAYDIDNTSKEWKAKYFNAEKIASDQQGQAAQLTLDKNKLLDELNKINKRVEQTNIELAAMAKDLANQRSQLEQKTKELEINKQISNLPFSCPSIVPAPKKKITKHKKRIPYDIAPSQQ